jgi:hypothetical protein
MDAKAFGEELIGTIESSPLEYSLRYVRFIPKTLILFKGFLPTPDTFNAFSAICLHILFIRT